MSSVRLYQVATRPPASPTKIEWLPLDEAARLFDGGYGDFQLTFQVKEPDGLVRTLCQEEMDTFCALAPTHGTHAR